MTAPGRVADVLRRRGVARVAYLHCDHFEPWRSPLGGVGEANAAHIRHFADVTAALPEARRLTLFYRPHLAPTATPHERAVFAPDTPLGFVRPDDAALAAARSGIGALAAQGGHAIELHIHHERVTANARYAAEGRWAGTLAGPGNDAAADSRRLDLLTGLSLATLRAETGLPHAQWLFIHGNWGLNGGDPAVCAVADELAILHRHGCRGDFTLPAPPPHACANPAYAAPVTVRPAPLLRAYDRAEGDPQPAFGAGEDAARLFVWAEPPDCPSSLDTFRPEVAARCADPLAWAADLAALAPVLGETLYVRTWAHSMAMRHTDEAGRTTFPHAHDGVRRMLGALLEAAGQVAFLTAAEARAEILAGGPAAP